MAEFSPVAKRFGKVHLFFDFANTEGQKLFKNFWPSNPKQGVFFRA